MEYLSNFNDPHRYNLNYAGPSPHTQKHSQILTAKDRKQGRQLKSRLYTNSITK